MKLNSGIEVQKIGNIDREKLSKSLYSGVEKKRSDIGLGIPSEFITSLECIVNKYMMIMGLDPKLYPARVDIGLSEEGTPIIYEITTGFVDQIGSCLEIMEACDIVGGREKLQEWPMNYATLTVPEYKNEYALTMQYLKSMGVKLSDDIEEEGINTLTDLCFVYGYPTNNMKGKANFIPGNIGLDAEEKMTQLKILTMLTQNTNFIIPRTFTVDDTEYSELPSTRYSEMIFKQVIPKMKGERNTIIQGKSKQTERRYEAGDMIAQEFIPNYKDSEGRRVEGKVIMTPTNKGSQCLGFYSLTDNRGTDSIINDGYPQGPGYII